MQKLLFYKKIVWVLASCIFLLQYGCKNDTEDANFTLSTSEVLLAVDEVLPVVALPSPDNTATGKIVWQSADPEIAQVQSDESGWVSGIKGLKIGSTTVTASSKDGQMQQSIAVRVIVKVKEIALGSENVIARDKIRYDIIFIPENPTIRDLIWTSSDPAVADVDEDGIITALSQGLSVITATTVEGNKSASVQVSVTGNPPVFGAENYCTITGYADYNPDEVRTQNAIQDLTHVNTSVPTATDNYGYYPEDKLIVKRGSAFTLHLVQSNNYSRSAVWIDWNGNRDFNNATERVAVFGNYEDYNNGPFSELVSVPANALLGLVRMRVITFDAWNPSFPDVAPCDYVRHGTIKDFDVEIID
jgi:hypothetical protein